MKYFLDTEFNGFGGDLISLALVREDGESLYLIYKDLDSYEPWVQENVIPILYKVPSPLPGMLYNNLTHQEGAKLISSFFNGDPTPYIITDWPDDVRYFCQAIITGPGTMVGIPRLIFDIVRVNAYPTNLKDAVQHNAWWDAKALREYFREIV